MQLARARIGCQSEARSVPWSMENLASILAGLVGEDAWGATPVQVIMSPCNRRAKEEVVPGSRSASATVCGTKAGELC